MTDAAAPGFEVRPFYRTPADESAVRAREVFPTVVAEVLPTAHLQDADGVRALGDLLAPFLLGDAA